MPIELTMIMTSLKILYHIDGNCNEKGVDGEVKATSKKKLIKQLGVNKTCLCWLIWISRYHAYYLVLVKTLV